MFVSIIVPCYNEAQYIKNCIRSVLGFELRPDTSIEIIVVDGGSTDGTRSIVEQIALLDPRIQLLENPGKIQASGLNIGFKVAQGERLLRLDAHSVYPSNYLRLLVETAQRTGCDNVGGVFITMPGGTGYQAEIVQALTTHRFGVGAGFRVGASEGPADTVPFGFYRREIVSRIGWFDERLVRAQDYEYNQRLRAAGGTIWRNPAIQVEYYNQSSLSKFYRKQLLHQAPYNAYMWFLAPYAFTPRHAATTVFTLGVLGGLLLSILDPIIMWLFISVLVLYFLLAIFSSYQQAKKYKQLKHLLVLPICFFLFHFMHGLGILSGLLRLLFRVAPVQAVSEPWSGAGRYRAWPDS